MSKQIRWLEVVAAVEYWSVWIGVILSAFNLITRGVSATAEMMNGDTCAAVVMFVFGMRIIGLLDGQRKATSDRSPGN